MRIFAGVIAVTFAAEAALACVCIEPSSPEERKEIAARVASSAAAVAEVELIEDMDSAAKRAELYRVHKVHFGKAPAQFRLARHFGDGGIVMSSCDVIPPRGERALVVLYPSNRAGTYAIGGTCDHLFVNSSGAVELILAEAGRGERG